MKRIVLATLVLCLITGQAAAKEYRISVSQFVEHPALDAVLKGFQDYMTKENLQVAYAVHNAQGNMATATQIAHQILGENPDLVLAIATPTAQACAQSMKKAENAPTLLFTAVTDPLAAGLVTDLRRPGGKITGVSDLLPVDKHMEMVKKFFPDLKTLGVIYNAGEANSKATVGQIRAEGEKLGFTVTEATVAKSSDVFQAAQSLVGRVDAIFIPTDNTVVSALESAIKVCVQHKVPLFCADVDSVARGAVAAMGFDYYQHGYQTGAMAHKILSGQSPAETPVESQETLQLHLNLPYAARMGVTVPEKVKAEADKIYQ